MTGQNHASEQPIPDQVQQQNICDKTWVEWDTEPEGKETVACAQYMRGDHWKPSMSAVSHVLALTQTYICMRCPLCYLC